MEMFLFQETSWTVFWGDRVSRWWCPVRIDVIKRPANIVTQTTSNSSNSKPKIPNAKGERQKHVVRHSLDEIAIARYRLEDLAAGVQRSHSFCIAGELVLGRQWTLEAALSGLPVLASAMKLSELAWRTN